MNVDQLNSAVAERSGLTKVDAGRAVAAVLEAIQDALKDGEKISLLGFGTFEISERAARTGRNPQTGAEIAIAASKAVKFRAGKKLKAAVND